MNNDVLLPSDLVQNKNRVGSKTRTLHDLRHLGCAVPPFVAVSSTASKRLIADPDFRESIVNEILRRLPDIHRFAVRSSALLEDQPHSSMAGQFRTMLDVKPADLEEAMKNILQHARPLLKGRWDHFSFLIQAFIEPNHAGVIFTRNPQGGREMVIESVAGRGEDLVSGRARPHRRVFYWAEIENVRHLPTLLAHNLSLFQRIERHFRFPQDIEWCIANGILFFLQTRPITTLSKEAYVEILRLEKVLPKGRPFYFSKTDATQTAPHPSPLTADLLQTLYATGGPVQRAYRSLDLSYDDTHFLVFIEGDLYVDVEKELHSLLPSYSFFPLRDFRPRFRRLRKLSRTFRNLWKLQMLGSTIHRRPLALPPLPWQYPSPMGNVDAELRAFLLAEEKIFVINILSGFAIKRAALALHHAPISLNQLLLFPSLVGEQFPNIDPPVNLQGNGCELTNQEPFVAQRFVEGPCPAPIQNWWKQLGPIKKNHLKVILRAAIRFHAGREIGRWITVWHMNRFRHAAETEAKRNGCSDVSLSAFAHLEELRVGQFSGQQCQRRRQRHLWNPHFPNILTHRFTETARQTIGVSSGKTEGVLRSVSYIETHSNFSKETILFVPALTPDLARFFKRIRGIVALQGGMLSHLAILAREHHLPVVICDALPPTLHIGDRIFIDGDSGDLRRLRFAAQDLIEKI